MIGYTIIDAAYIRSVEDDDIGSKVILLDNGRMFKVLLLILPPLPLTDVIIFGKKPKDSDIIFIKLLIDNETYDAIPLR